MSSPEGPSPFAPLQAAWARVAEMANALPRPARILLVTTVAAGLVLGGWLFLRSAYEPYTALFTELDEQDATAVVAKLKELKVPYRVGADRGRIDVPEARVHELRMELAGTGVVRGGGLGFEGFDKMRLGATEFEQRVMYRRAMEGELGRTIGSIAAVQSARVHLVMPEKSVFAARREPASASVVVRLKPGRHLGSAEVAGVVNLVAAAVPGLGGEKVSLVTTEGAVLHRPRPEGAEEGGGGFDGDRASQGRAVENALEERARAMLERLYGPGHTDVRVSAELDLARVERVEDRYDPARAALRSEEQTIERAVSDNTDDTAAGVPGAESNLPNGAAPAPAAGSAASMANVTRESHTRNFEIDHVSEKRVSMYGAIRRLTVAVVVDGVVAEDGSVEPRSREDLDKIESLVRSAVGVDPRRDDVITVESIPFLPSGDIEPVDAPAEVPRVIALVRTYWPIGAAALGVLVVVALLFALRGRRKPLELTPVADTTADAIAELTGAPVPPKLTAATAAADAPPEERNYREEAVRRAQDDPATAALVLRHWLGTAAEDRPT